MAKIFLFPGMSYGLVGGSVEPERLALSGDHEVITGRFLPTDDQLASFDLFIVNIDPRGVAIRPDYPGVDFIEAHGKKLESLDKPLIATTKALDFGSSFKNSLHRAGVSCCVPLAVLDGGSCELPEVDRGGRLTKAVDALLSVPVRKPVAAPECTEMPRPA